MSRKRRYPRIPQDRQLPWFVNVHSKESSWARWWTNRKHRNETKQAIREGRYEDASQRMRGTQGWITH